MAGVKGRSGRRKAAEELPVEARAVKNSFLKLDELDDFGKMIFERVYSMCEDVMKPTDEIAFNLAMLTFQEWRIAYNEVKKHGKYEYNEKSGMRVLSPAFKAERKYYEDLVRMLREFNLTPSSRAAVGRIANPDPQERRCLTRGFISNDLGDPMP